MDSPCAIRDLHGSLVGDFFPTRLVLAETVFKLFVSSPGDVAAERARAEAVVEKLNAELTDRCMASASERFSGSRRP